MCHGFARVRIPQHECDIPRERARSILSHHQGLFGQWRALKCICRTLRGYHRLCSHVIDWILEQTNNIVYR